MGGDFGVEADEGFAQVGFNEHVVDAARQTSGGDIIPACAFVIASERDVRRGVLVTLPACYGRRCDSREQADDIVFDGVLFVEHGFSSQFFEIWTCTLREEIQDEEESERVKNQHKYLE